jgi:hypothetical protein
MPQITRTSSRPVLAVLMLALASVALAACGGSSKSSSTTTATASASTSTAGGTKGAQGRFTELRECLQKNGVTLPKFNPGKRPSPGSGGFLGGSGGAGGPQLPKGMSRAQYEAVLKKCGGDFGRGGGFRGLGSRFSSPAVKEGLDKFATCMRQNGVNVPSPNTSGKGPVFNTKGLNTSSATFREAESKCRSDLQGAFRARPGGVAAPGGTPSS